MNQDHIQSIVNSPMFKEMMGDQAESIDKMMEDPKMVNQMSGFWKQLDEMHSSDEKGYREFVEKQKVEFDKEQEKVNKERELKRIVEGQPICSIKILVAKIVVKSENKNLSDTIKLFDFEQTSEIKDSFLENEDHGEPLDQPKLYLNVVYSDKVIGPLLKDRELADPKDDKTWAVIPISFGQNKERWSGAGKKCIHIDAYVNTCIYDQFKKGAQKIGALTNYIIERFQNVLKDHYIFHKKAIKIIKGKKYRAYRGPNDVVPEYILPEAFHVDHYDKVLKKIKEAEARVFGEKEKKFEKDLV